MPQRLPNGHKYKTAYYSAGKGSKVLLEEAIRLLQLAKERLNASPPGRKRK